MRLEVWKRESVYHDGGSFFHLWNELVLDALHQLWKEINIHIVIFLDLFLGHPVEVFHPILDVGNSLDSRKHIGYQPVPKIDLISCDMKSTFTRKEARHET